MTPIRTELLEPTTDGYQRMAEVFALQILSDAKQQRRPDTTHILKTYTELVGYLAAHHPDHYRGILEFIGRLGG